jgi:hypothetical protein
MHAARALTFVAAIVAGLAVTASAAAPFRPAVAPITPAGVNAVRLGATYQHLRAVHAIGPVRPGCELAGPRARSARLLSPLRGSVDLTQSTPRRVATIAITGGAAAHGVGVGATAADIRRAFPTARFDHTTEAMFTITLVTARRADVGRVQFAISTASKRVSEIGVPQIPFCE